MAKPRDHMLEAFRDSQKAATAPTPAQAAGGSARHAGAKTETGARETLAEARSPLAADEPEREEVSVAAGGPFTAREEPLTPPRMPSGGIELPIGKEGFLILQVMLLAVAFLFGRLTAETAAAGEPAGAEAESESPAAQPESAPPPEPVVRFEPAAEEVLASVHDEPAAGAAADEAFLDEANAISIVAITLPATERGRELAWTNHAHLAAHGYPVVTPRLKGNKLQVFVGAVPSGQYKELDALARRLQAELGPDGKLAYEDAYLVNLDDFR